MSAVGQLPRSYNAKSCTSYLPATPAAAVALRSKKTLGHRGGLPFCCESCGLAATCLRVSVLRAHNLVEGRWHAWKSKTTGRFRNIHFDNLPRIYFYARAHRPLFLERVSFYPKVDKELYKDLCKLFEPPSDQTSGCRRNCTMSRLRRLAIKAP